MKYNIDELTYDSKLGQVKLSKKHHHVHTIFVKDFPRKEILLLIQGGSSIYSVKPSTSYRRASKVGIISTVWHEKGAFCHLYDKKGILDCGAKK